MLEAGPGAGSEFAAPPGAPAGVTAPPTRQTGSVSSPPSTLDTPPAGTDRSRPWYASPTGLLKAVGIGLVVSTFGIWGYAYSGRADRPTPDLLADQTFPAAAEEICASAVADISAMPQALDAKDNGERADQVRASTARFEQMIGELAVVMGGTPRDVAIEQAWLGDWRVVVEDRYRYADAVADNPAAPYYMTDTGVNERLDRRVSRLATTNRMPSCGYPDDVG